MTTRFRVALQGFSDFERDALTSSFRLAGSRQPSYRLVHAMAGSDFIVADADNGRVRNAIVTSGRLVDTIFIGDDGPDGAHAVLPRPIDPTRLLRELDRIVSLREAPAQPGEFALVDEVAGAARSATPALGLPLAAVDAWPEVAAVQPADVPGDPFIGGAAPRVPPRPTPAAVDLPLLDQPLYRGEADQRPRFGRRDDDPELLSDPQAPAPGGAAGADADADEDTVRMGLDGPDDDDRDDDLDPDATIVPGVGRSQGEAGEAGEDGIGRLRGRRRGLRLRPSGAPAFATPDANPETPLPAIPVTAGAGAPVIAVLPPGDVEFPPLSFDPPPAAPAARGPSTAPSTAPTIAPATAPATTPALEPATSPAPLSAVHLDAAEEEAERQRRADAKAAARAAARRARLQAAGLPEDADETIDVLVLDDSEIARRFLGKLLEAFGFRVHGFERSAAAIQRLATQPFAAVFLDIVLGPDDNIDGLELCRRIHHRELPLAGDMPKLMVVSGQAAPADRVRAKLAGCDVFLGKPLTRGDVARAFEACRVRLPSDARRL